MAALAQFLVGKQASGGPKGHKIDGRVGQHHLDEMPRSQWWNVALSSEKSLAELEAMKQQYEESKKRLENRFLDKVEKLQRGDELPLA